MSSEFSLARGAVYRRVQKRKAEDQGGYQPEACPGSYPDVYPGAYRDIAEQEKTRERRRSNMKNDKTTHDARVLYKYNKVRHWGMFPPHVQAPRS